MAPEVSASNHTILARQKKQKQAKKNLTWFGRLANSAGNVLFGKGTVVFRWMRLSIIVGTTLLLILVTILGAFGVYFFGAVALYYLIPFYIFGPDL